MPGTRCINARELRQMYERLGPQKTEQHLTEALERRWLKPDDFSIRELAENLVPGGREWVRSMSPAKHGNYRLLEAGSVEYGSFSNITGQIFFTQIRERYQAEEFVFSKLVPTVKSTLPDVEKIPGFGGIGDQFRTPVKEGDPYPHVGVTEDYLHVAGKKKYGGVIAVTKEAIFGDRTGELLSECKESGHYMGVGKEIRLIDTLLDAGDAADTIYNGGTRYHWKNTSYGTYQSSTPWINVKTSNALEDWTDIQAAELIQAAITDPYTGLPVLIEATHVIVPPDLKHTAQRVVTAGDVRTTSPGFATSGSPQQYTAPNPTDAYTVLSSRLLKQRMTSAGSPWVASSSWIFGNPKKAMAYYENWPLQIEQLGATTQMAFDRDVVWQMKVSEKGTPAWLNPRFVVRCTA